MCIERNLKTLNNNLKWFKNSLDIFSKTFYETLMDTLL